MNRQTSSTGIASAVIAILLGVPLVGYVGGYLALGSVICIVVPDQPPRDVKFRKYKEAWLATVFKPGARVESAITGCRVTAKCEAPEPSQWEHFDGVVHFAP